MIGFSCSCRPASGPRTSLRSYLPWISGAALLLIGCVHPSKPETPKPTSISGRVVQAMDVNRGVPEVLVRAVGKPVAIATDSTGSFSLVVDVPDGEIVQISASKAGYDEFVTSLAVRAGRSNPLPVAMGLTISGGSSGGTGGPANSVVLKSSSAFSIGVLHSGSNESAVLLFEVRDAQAQPVNRGHRATVRFTLSQIASGGATMSPDTVSTDSAGHASVTVNSGTLAQVVQVRAEVVGTSIHSDPAVVAIHGGLPNAQHFSFAPATINVAGLLEFGILDKVTAFVGDVYGNPVPAGTLVYFSTTGGLIQGSAMTDDHGRATVDLVTAEPIPNAAPALSDSAGIARVSIQTVGENQSPIVRSSLAVVFSGHTQLLVSPTSFSIPLGGAQDFTVMVRDQEHHNPLTAGTTITFSTTLGSIAGEASVVLPDTRDPQYTSFTFRIENPATGPVILGPNRAKVRLGGVASSHSGTVQAVYASAGSPGVTGPQGAAVATPAKVTVRVTSDNGNASAFVSGTLDRP